MKYWQAYTRLVNRNCSSPGIHGKDLSYWRDNVFAGTIIYLLPFSLIALLPGLYFTFITRQYILLVVDILFIFAMPIVAFKPDLNLHIRKIISISVLYAIGCALLYYLGLRGPALLYLLATCIISILIFPSAYTFWPAWLNTIICLFFILALQFHFIPESPCPCPYTPIECAVVSSNLVFLSFLCSALIPRLLNGLQDTLNQEKQLTVELDMQQKSLQHALAMLQQKNNDLEQFAYVASHDLKEPLRMVTSFMGLLKMKYDKQLDVKAHTYIDFAIDGGKRMQKMIADLLELSRSARQDGVRELIDLNKLFEEVKQNIFKLLEENHVEIILKTKLPVLSVYKIDFIRLLQNLLSNAIKFRKKDLSPVISISAAEKDTHWLFCIEDNGIGIETEKHEKIFEIFTRLHSQVKYEGTGIGLAICRKIVERNGGEIWVESEEGKGSNFCFTIAKN